jgi:hypothetical protein
MGVALLALFVALGGGAYAAVSAPANSVGTKQIKNGAVTRTKLANNAVTSAKVKDGSLLAQDFKAGQLPAGPPGPQGVAKTVIVKQDMTLPPGASGSPVALCPSGDHVTGGGYDANSSVMNYVHAQEPTAVSGHPDGWTVSVVNNSGSTVTFSAFALCVPGS